MYRPEGWEDIKTDKIGTDRGMYCSPYQCDLFFEIGADAMLEALMKQNTSPGVIYHNRQFGFWLRAFIPEA